MLRILSAVALFAAAAAPLAAQRADFQWNKALSAGSTVTVNNINGDIKIVPSTSGRVEVNGYKHGSSRYTDHLKVDVHEGSRGVTICVLRDDNDSYCDDGGVHTDRRGWQGDRNNDWGNGDMRLELAVPTNLLVHPSTVSGDITVSGMHGDISANSVSGDIRMDDMHAAALHANTVSGDVRIEISELTGSGDFSFHSVSGDLELTLPRTFSADVNMTTVSGDVDSDFAMTLTGGRFSRRGGLTARIGQGGRRLDVSTVSGDLKLHQR